jgi:hypothetical protein
MILTSDRPSRDAIITETRSSVLAVVATEETVKNRREANRQNIDAKMFPIMAVAVLN